MKVWFEKIKYFNVLVIFLFVLSLSFYGASCNYTNRYRTLDNKKYSYYNSVYSLEKIENIKIDVNGSIGVSFVVSSEVYFNISNMGGKEFVVDRKGVKVDSEEFEYRFGSMYGCGSEPYLSGGEVVNQQHRRVSIPPDSTCLLSFSFGVPIEASEKEKAKKRVQQDTVTITFDSLAIGSEAISPRRVTLVPKEP